MMTITTIVNGWLIEEISNSYLRPALPKIYKATKEEVAEYVLKNLESHAEIEDSITKSQQSLSVPVVLGNAVSSEVR